MTKRARDTNRRWPRLLLASLAAALITLFGAGTASATTTPIAQTRACSATMTAPTYVGPQLALGAGQRQGDDSATHNVKLAIGAAARPGIHTIEVTGPATIYDTAGSNYDARARLLRARGDVPEPAGADLREPTQLAVRLTATRSPTRSFSGFGVAAEAATVAEEGASVAVNGETAATALGRATHAAWDYGPGFEKEFTLEAGGRVDAINFETREVVELKPNNPRQIRLGGRQLDGYIAKLNAEFPGAPWIGRLVTYGP